MEKDEKAIKEEIRILLEQKGREIEEAAERIAPDFDYELEAAKLEEELNSGRKFLKGKHRKPLLAILIAVLAVLGWQVAEWGYIHFNSIETTAMIGGEEQEFTLIPGTVEENLEYNEIAFDEDDEISPALDEEADEEHQIRVDEATYTSEEKTEKVKMKTYVMLDPKMDSGVQKQDKGNNGKGVFVYRTKTVNGEDAGTERELKEWIKEPHDRVLHLGTARTGHKGKYKVTNEFTANCSAYWMGDNCYGAGGGKCVYGTVAVDRSRYPYETMFWIEGYGFAVANDCGTSIKGDKLDLWMDSYAESCRWGRQHRTTYVLEEVK